MKIFKLMLNNYKSVSEKREFSIISKNNIVNNVYFNSHRRVSLHMTRRSVSTTILGGTVFRNYDFNDRMLLFLLRKNIHLAIPQYGTSCVKLGRPWGEVEFFSFYRHVLAMRRVHDLLSSQHFTLVRLPSHPLTLEGYEVHRTELDLVTRSSNPELAFDSPIADTSTLYNNLCHEATYLGSFNDEVVSHQIMSMEWWIVARDISQVYKPKLQYSCEYIYDHFDELYPDQLRDNPVEMSFFPQGTIYDPFSQPGLATERLLQEAITSNNFETIQAIHDNAHLAASFLT